MAVSYRVLQDEVSLLQPVGELKNKDGVYNEELVSVTYMKGDEILESQLSHAILVAYSEEDPHTLSILERLPDTEPPLEEPAYVNEPEEGGQPQEASAPREAADDSSSETTSEEAPKPRKRSTTKKKAN